MMLEKYGSFNITTHQARLGSVFTVQYTEEHTPILKWEFLDEQLAIEFCKQKTKTDKKIYKKQEVQNV